MYNRPVAQIPQCSSPISHNVLFCNRNVLKMCAHFCYESGWALGGFSKVLATVNHVGGPFNLFMATTGDVWIIPSFQIGGYVLHVQHISCVITNCGSFLNCSLGFAGGKHQKITITILRLVLKKIMVASSFTICYLCYLLVRFVTAVDGSM